MTKTSLALIVFYIIIAAWWCVLFFGGTKFQTANYLYQFAFGLIPIFGGIMGIVKSAQWGGIKSKVGIALFLTSAGLIAWGIGQMFWSVFYNLILGVEVPYPSLADVGYITAVPLWSLGIVYLSKATGARFSLKKAHGKMLLYFVPIALVALSYYLLVEVARGGVISDFTGGGLKIFFDFAYPLGDVLILTLAVLIFGLSIDYLGGKYRLPIFTLLLGFVIMYAADFTFSYVTTAETYYNGHVVDLLFPTAMTLIAIGVNNFEASVD